MEDTFRAFKHAAQIEKFHFFFDDWRREKTTTTATGQKQNLSHEIGGKLRKKERKKEFVCAMKIHYNSINSMGMPINEANSIVQEKWIMRYPIDDCVCVCVCISFFFCH